MNSINFFQWVTRNHKFIVGLSILAIIAVGSFLPKMVKDTTSTAFVHPENPVLIYRDKVKETFGLKDPLVVGVYHPVSIYNEESLMLISKISEQLQTIEGIDPDQIRSIATENNIEGTFDGMEVEVFYEVDIMDSETPGKVKAALEGFDLYQGSLVSKDGKVALIIAEVLEIEGQNNTGTKAYKNILALVEEINAGENEIHVAGEGAISDYLTSYIDTDAQRLNPMAALIITLILILAYRTFSGAFIPNLVVGGTVIITLGSMAGFGVPFYVITNALPVVLIAIAVADSIHIFGQYYEEARDHPNMSQKELVVKSMSTIFRPVTVTTLTTIAGFLGIAFSSNMPPFNRFGLFAAIGVFAAYLLSILVIPSVLMLFKPKSSKALGKKDSKPDFFSRLMDRLGDFVMAKPKVIVFSGIAVVLVGIIGSLKLEVNYAPIRNFRQTEPIVLADNLVNEHSDGTSFLDIVVETPEIDGLYQPGNLKKMEALQEWVTTLPHVQGSTSIVDLIKKMNRSLNENQKEFYTVPENEMLVAQEFLLYSASGEPTDFENFVDYDYQVANIRVAMNSPLFQDKKVVVQEIQNYLDTQFNDENIKATLSGNVTLDYEWLKSLGYNHFLGMGIALLLIIIVASLSFRSLAAGIFTVVPVTISILLIYAVMGFGNMWLDIGTTMFAAIAIGAGVDFAVHTVDRLIFFMKDKGLEIHQAMREFYKSTGRALLFNLLALALGFGVLVTSIVPPLVNFGALVAIAVSTCFIASMTLLPAMIYLIRPDFTKATQQFDSVIKEEKIPAEILVH